MEDTQIIELYQVRAESALSETADKYGRYCRRIAYNILHSEQDSEECVNDTWLRAWNSIPPQRPNALKAFLGTITRNLALDRYDARRAERRGMGQTPLVLEELEECIPASGDAVDGLLLADVLDRFLASLSAERRRLFMGRYWYFATVRELAAAYGMGESGVRMSLLRTRNELKRFLEKEGITL